MDEATARQWPRAASVQEVAITNMFPEEKRLKGITLMRGIQLETTPKPPACWTAKVSGWILLWPKEVWGSAPRSISRPQRLQASAVLL